jgi:hypothetical protein
VKQPLITLLFITAGGFIYFLQQDFQEGHRMRIGPEIRLSSLNNVPKWAAKEPVSRTMEAYFLKNHQEQAKFLQHSLE